MAETDIIHEDEQSPATEDPERHNVGKFRLHHSMANLVAVRELFQVLRFVPVQVNHDTMADEIEYVGSSPRFRPIPPGRKIPEYYIKMEFHRGAGMTFEIFEREDDGKPLLALIEDLDAKVTLMPYGSPSESRQIIVNGEWTGGEDWGFRGQTYEECVRSAKVMRSQEAASTAVGAIEAMHKRAVRWALAQGYTVSVRDYGEGEWDLAHSRDFAEIIDAIEATDLPNVAMYDKGQHVSTFSVIDEGIPAETINDYTLGPHSKPFDDWFSQAVDDYDGGRPL